MTAPYPDTSEAPGSLLAPEPAARTGALISYARVSTSGQLLDRQQHALAEAGCLRVFADKLSGKNADRPELTACLDYLRSGDTLGRAEPGPAIPFAGRPDRNRRHAAPPRVGFKSLHEALDTTTAPGGRLVFHVFAALAEFIRELIVEGTREGLDAARARGAPQPSPAMTAEQIRHACDLLTRPDNTVSSIARLLGVSRATNYKYVPEVIAGPQAVALPPR